MESITSVQAALEHLTIFKIDAVEDVMDNLAASAGLPTDQTKYVLALLLNYPIAMIYARLPSATAKHWFNIVVGIMMAQFVFGHGWIHSFISSAIVYIMMRVLPGGVSPYAVFLFSLAYMSGSHLYSLYTNYLGWELDHTGPQMILTIKMSSLAFNVYDGGVGKKEVKEGRAGEGQRRVAIPEVPSVVEYFGFIYCFPCFLCGPAFEYMEYISSANGSSYEGKPSSSSSSSSSSKPPPNLLAGLGKLVQAVTYLAIHLAVQPYLPLEDLLSAERLSRPFLERVVMCWVTMIVLRGKYYFGWKIAEGASVVAGYGFEGYNDDGSVKGWSGVSNIDVVAFETAPNIRGASRAWNKATQGWLERYVYIRTGGSLVATYFVSAFWHGFYPGFYIFFLSLPLATELARLLRSRVRPFFLPPANPDGSESSARPALKLVYDVVGQLLTSLTLNYLVGPFQLLSWERSMALLSGFFFSGHIAMLLMYAAVRFLLPAAPGRAKKKTA